MKMTQKVIKISVITVVRNDKDGIEKTILSILSQTYQIIEFIIVDGGSKDGTVDVIKKYADKIAYWVSESDKGVYDAMNKGIAASTGDFVIFMNSGDTFHSMDAIEKMISDSESSNSLIYGNVSVKYWDGVVVEKPNEFFKTSMKFKGVGICHQTVFFPGEVIRKMRYDLSYRIASDYDLMHRMWKNGINFIYRDVVVADYEWGNGISSNPYKILDVYRENARVCGQQWNPLYLAKLALEWYRLKKKL